MAGRTASARDRHALLLATGGLARIARGESFHDLLKDACDYTPHEGLEITG